ncbi:MAG: potassium channel protein [candidate division Zixibacteria bacterium]|nr:potassium channel protein [candidate division Zixibacteria bacterium]
MRAFPAEIIAVLRGRRGRRNLRVLTRFFIVLTVMIVIYSILFHVLMLREGQDHTWITGLYWTLTVMSTLGFGDITFHTDIGRLFSIIVLLSGMIFLLVLLPFTFIEFFYEPWMKAQAATRAPRQLPPETRGHVLITSHDAVTGALIRRLEQYQYRYAILVSEVEDALRLHDLGFKVVVGDLDDPDTWTRVRVEAAALVASTGTDITNTNVAFTVRELAKDVSIITTASDEASVDILNLAGSSYVLRLEEMIGQSFATRTLGGDKMSHVLGQFDEVQIAEATASRTPLVGKTLRENALREKVGVTVVGVWERGHFEAARAETRIRENTVLVLAGLKQHLARYNELFGDYSVAAAPVVILGGGRVGRATARALARQEVDYRIVEVLPERIRDSDKYVLGSAADLEVLEKAGIRETSTVIITPHDDDLNVYLTIYCRQLRPDIQILSRATHERNVATLHRAGADSVLSYASMGASAVMNMLQRGQILLVAEGLQLFKVRVPDKLANKTIAESTIREFTGCSLVAIRTERGTEVIPDPFTRLPAEADIVLIGGAEAEERFLELYAEGGT